LKAITMLSCPSCDAVYMLYGEFIDNKGRIVRASTIPSDQCEKCSVIAGIVGLTENLMDTDAYSDTGGV